MAVAPVRRRVDPSSCLPHVVWAKQSSVPVAAQPVVQSAQEPGAVAVASVRRVDPSSCLPHVVAEGGQAFAQNVLKPPFEHAVASASELPTTVFNPVASMRLAKARARAGMVGNTGKTKKIPDSPPGFPDPALYSEKCVLNKCMQDFLNGRMVDKVLQGRANTLNATKTRKRRNR